MKIIVAKSSSVLGTMVALSGYTEVAHADCDHGRVVLMHNNSSHYLIAEVEDPDSGRGMVVKVFPYSGVDLVDAYQSALEEMVRRAVAHTESFDFNG